MKLVECVPNFSEGRDQAKIREIAEAVRSVEGVTLLDVDSGKDTNRTVMTFAGPPDAAAEAAFRAIEKAARVIDMSVHRGAHPRIGATDVCPFVPISGVTMEECAELARNLGRRVGGTLGIPVYLYEEAASVPERKNLADIRAGEYEGLPGKLKQAKWKPDFGPSEFKPKTGAAVIGARTFLIAYNVNLNTQDAKIAREIALTIREKGRFERDGQGNILRGKDGEPRRVPGTFVSVKAVGWYMEAFGRAQVSINLTDPVKTPLHIVFDECCRLADRLGARVTGSELVGLIPLDAVLNAGRYFLKRQGKTPGAPESELVHTAVLSLGLGDLAPFDPEKKIIEYCIGRRNRFSEMRLGEFLDLLSSEAPAPGGGSASALCGSIGSALVSMVASLTHGKKGYETVTPEMETLGIKGHALKDGFLDDAGRDSDAFNRLMEASRLPKKTDTEKVRRESVLEQAGKEAALVPLEVLRRSRQGAELAERVAEKGNRNSVSDAGVAALALHAAAEGAYFNIRINLPSVRDRTFKKTVAREAETLRKEVQRLTRKTVTSVQNTLMQREKKEGE